MTRRTPRCMSETNKLYFIEDNRQTKTEADTLTYILHYEIVPFASSAKYATANLAKLLMYSSSIFSRASCSVW